MSDADNLEALSNADLRAQCIAHGLPNVPVTDSSRKVLIKKLRVSLGGGNSPAAASPKKANNRRETVHAARQLLPDKVNDSEPEEKDNQRGKNRRPSSATPAAVDNKKDVPAQPAATAAPPAEERRRAIREQVTTKNAIVERATEEKSVEEQPVTKTQATAPRIQTRRISTQSDEAAVQRPLASRIPQRREAIIEEEPPKSQPVYASKEAPRLVKRNYDVVPEAQPPKPVVKPVQPTYGSIAQRRISNTLEEPVRQNVLLRDSLIELSDEDEEEEEEEAARIAAQAEEFLKQQRTLANKKPSPPTYEKNVPLSSSVNTARNTELYKKTFYSGLQAKEPPTAGNTYADTNLYGSGRYSSSTYATPPSHSGFLSSAGITAASSPYASSSNIQRAVPPCANEFSDEAEQSDPEQMSTPFLSTFARNLERLRAEPLASGSGSTPINRRTVAAVVSSNYSNPASRRSLRKNDDDVSGALRRFWYALDRKYKLKSKLYILLAIIIFIGLYVVIF